MAEEDKNRLILQYKEAGTWARQLDTRIWEVYGLYFVINGGALALLFHSQGTVFYLRLLFVCDLLLAVGVGQMALVGHLQRYSDYFFELLRATELQLGISVHQKICEPPPSRFLFGPHLWLSYLRGRDVLQFFTILLCLGCVLYPIYKAMVLVYPSMSKYLHEPTITAWLITFVLFLVVCGMVVFFLWVIGRKHLSRALKPTRNKPDLR